jgi:cyclopropane fatty-acyl-phospholipid synthase-like methyltransferase
MGAGNCWLSNRLAMRGHNVIALDLQVNQFDGLGAYIHYENSFTPVQAEFDSLPVIDKQFDLIVFNASFHYSTNYSATLQDAFLKLKEAGCVVILDTPIYKQNESGVRMVKERESEFTSKYGFPSNSVPIQNFLTNGQIEEISSDLGINWSLIKPNYGLKWALRPWLAHLRGDREPASFSILIGGKVHQSG